ncbi:MAG: hydroxymethylglutaryl-CoA reductase, degradative [Anaerolineae bacterium]|nr:hydroxymethylglutaryl-CoA reductase, degradative [Anaerolineae bacterium]
MEVEVPSSRLSGFYKLDIDDRARIVAEWAGLGEEDLATLRQGLTLTQADKMTENVVGLHALPLSIAVNFLINGRDYLVPMVIEEPSVVAGASHAAKLAREGGGFQAESDEPVMIGQIQVLDLPDLEAARAAILNQKRRLLDLANQIDPVVVRLGGGARDIEVRTVTESPAGPMLVIHLLYDCRDAMGANTVNTACETLAPEVETITGGRVNLRILSNLADRRMARARCVVPASALTTNDMEGAEVVDRIVAAYALAAVDPYRAATHNKGIMNGIDAVVIATGNDWRAIEAGAHAYAARDGRYRSLSVWEKDEAGNLIGRLEMPLALGIVGGTTRAHPTARLALRILGVRTARELAEITVAVGLAQNLAAIRALATEGIQRGHMALHARQVAIAAGAEGDEIDWVVKRMVAERAVRLDRAQALLTEHRRNVEGRE